jgi:hypothetical protein
MAETCGHAGCNCPARDDGYCSDSCVKDGVDKVTDKVTGND